MVDRDYWNGFYSSANLTAEPSPFACFTSKYVERGCRLLDLGCGNGRDSLYFAGLGLNVTGVDSAKTAIDALKREHGDEMRFIADDFVTAECLSLEKYRYIYARFVIHAILKSQEGPLISNVFGALEPGGLFFVEVRSVNDDIFGLGECVEENAYIYNGHMRRFIDGGELRAALLSVGFEIAFMEEGRGFAPYKTENPVVIRVIAQKPV